MSVSLSRLEQTPVPELTTTIRNAGIGGAGGAGFPTYAKWERVESVDALLINHQESEPNFFIDKWLGRTHTAALATLFDALLDQLFDVIVVASKVVDRNEYTSELEAATDATVYLPEELPIDEETGVVFAYTDDRYEYGMESVLLRLVDGTVIGDDLPMDHGWIVQNTESIHNLYRTLTEGTPVTHKYLHVDGDVPRHRFLRAPIGTPATELLRAAGCPVTELPADAVLADGGPGWCFLIDELPDRFGVRKRTNGILVTDEDTATENTLGEDRINLLREYDRSEAEMETEPTATLDPDYVRIPMITNAAFEGVVQPSEPIVEPGDRVETGQMIATPNSTGISIPQHASIDGTVTAVSERCVEIETNDRGQAIRAMAETGTGIGYWTWCMACGAHVIPPLDDPMLDLTRYVCPDCR